MKNIHTLTQKQAGMPGIQHNAFGKGRQEPMPPDNYLDFRRLVIRTPQKALSLMHISPECLVYAAQMMSNTETLAENSLDAADLLVRAVRAGADAGPAVQMISHIMRTDELSIIRAKAADILALHAEAGNDVSSVRSELEAAARDRCPEVRANARRALQASDSTS